MNGFLVMLRHSMDDLPLLLTADYAEAKAFASKVTEEDGANEQKITGVRVGDCCSVCIYEFRDGRMKSVQMIRDFTR